MAVQPREVPSDVPVSFDGAIGESLDLSDTDAVTLEDTSDHPSAGGPEVDGGEDPGSHRQRKNAAATPASTGTNIPVV
jgi:hypothetical protein